MRFRKIARFPAGLLLKLLQLPVAWVLTFALLTWAFSSNPEPSGFSALLPRPVFHSDPFSAIWIAGLCLAAIGAGLVWLGFEPFHLLLVSLRNQSSRAPGLLQVVAFCLVILSFVLARGEHTLLAIVAGVFAVAVRLVSAGWSLRWMIAGIPAVIAFVVLVASHDGRLPYTELNAEGRAERDEELAQIMQARRANELARDQRVRELLEGFYTDLNAGRFDANQYFEKSVERFSSLTDTSPDAINHRIQSGLFEGFPGCAFGFEPSTLKSENIELYSFVESVQCPPGKPSRLNRRTSTRVRLALEGTKRLTLYWPIKDAPGATKHAPKGAPAAAVSVRTPKSATRPVAASEPTVAAPSSARSPSPPAPAPAPIVPTVPAERSQPAAVSEEAKPIGARPLPGPLAPSPLLERAK
jgi:hypothetical protein